MSEDNTLWLKAIVEWEAQGRTDEEKWAVRNFFTGRGIKLLKDIRQDEREKELGFLANLKLEFDANIGVGGDHWDETDAAKMVNDRIDRLTPRKEDVT